MTTLEIVLLVLLVLFLIGGFAVNHLILLGLIVVVVLFVVGRRGDRRL